MHNNSSIAIVTNTYSIKKSACGHTNRIWTDAIHCVYSQFFKSDSDIDIDM